MVSIPYALDLPKQGEPPGRRGTLSIVAPEFTFRQFGVFSVLAVHNSTSDTLTPWSHALSRLVIERTYTRGDGGLAA
jgi:hypothetical protein